MSIENALRASYRAPSAMRLAISVIAVAMSMTSSTMPLLYMENGTLYGVPRTYGGSLWKNGLSRAFLIRTSLFAKVNDASPVSYTHLRAHETPEHLVCRLLLEKKK